MSHLPLQAQLLEMKTRLIHRLERRLEGGDLALLASVSGALTALDHLPVAPEPTEYDEGDFTCDRAVVAACASGVVVAFYRRGEIDPRGEFVLSVACAATFLADAARILAAPLSDRATAKHLERVIVAAERPDMPMPRLRSWAREGQ